MSKCLTVYNDKLTKTFIMITLLNKHLWLYQDLINLNVKGDFFYVAMCLCGNIFKMLIYADWIGLS